MGRNKRKIIMVQVTTVRLSDMQITDNRNIDYARDADRLWLQKHNYWCFNNGHGVQMQPAEVLTNL